MILRRLINLIQRKRQKLHLLKSLEKPCFIDETARFVYHHNISIAKYTRIGHENHLDGEGGLTIGEGTILASKVTILTSSHIYKQKDYLPYNADDELLPVNIGQGVWLGWGAMIRPGVQIGDGAVIAMGAVVAKHVPKGAVVAGNPAKIIGRRDNEWIDEIVKKQRYYLKAVIEEGLKRTSRKQTVDYGALLK
ncbi:MAG: acyltransferase [Deltaproteobacteria bacterium]|nr:acyltransferase [Deltaproteobacteria bacterium]